MTFRIEYKILQADCNNGVSEYPNDPTNFHTPADKIDFLEPKDFLESLEGLDPEEEIFCMIDKENEDKEIYDQIKAEYGIR